METIIIENNKIVGWAMFLIIWRLTETPKIRTGYMSKWAWVFLDRTKRTNVTKRYNPIAKKWVFKRRLNSFKRVIMSQFSRQEIPDPWSSSRKTPITVAVPCTSDSTRQWVSDEWTVGVDGVWRWAGNHLPSTTIQYSFTTYNWQNAIGKQKHDKI